MGVFFVAKTPLKAMKKDNNEANREEIGNANSIMELMRLLSSVDINSQEAKLNETTISDGKGGRIFL